MSTSEIITSTKFGPAVAVSIVLSTNVLCVLTYLQVIDPSRAALLVPTLFTIFLILYRMYLQHNAFLNFYWLKYFRNLEPDIKLDAHDYRDDQSTQGFNVRLTFSNKTFHSIEKFLLLLFLPRAVLPQGENFPTEDRRRSTSTHICLKAPGPNEKEPSAISTSDPRIMSTHLVFQRGSLNEGTLKHDIQYIAVAEGLVVAKNSARLSDLVELKADTKLSIKPFK